MRTAKITIWGSPDESVEYFFEYEHYAIRKFFGEETTIFVNYAKVLKAIPFNPSDLIEDIYHAVAVDLGEHPKDVRVDCDPEYSVKPVRTVIVQPMYNLNEMFV